jgi:hypothetical protein
MWGSKRILRGRSVGVVGVVFFLRFKVAQGDTGPSPRGVRGEGPILDAIREVGRLESDLTAIQAILCASEEETASG